MLDPKVKKTMLERVLNNNGYNDRNVQIITLNPFYEEYYTDKQERKLIGFK